jgi:hypothetical protein
MHPPVGEEEQGAGNVSHMWQRKIEKHKFVEESLWTRDLGISMHKYILT